MVTVNPQEYFRLDASMTSADGKVTRFVAPHAQWGEIRHEPTGAFMELRCLKPDDSEHYMHLYASSADIADIPDEEIVARYDALKAEWEAVTEEIRQRVIRGSLKVVPAK
jgi:hypothetical protein